MKRPCMVSFSPGRWTIQLLVTKEVQQQLNVRLFPGMTMALKSATNPGSCPTQQLGFMENSSPKRLHWNFTSLCDFGVVGVSTGSVTHRAVYQISMF